MLICITEFLINPMKGIYLVTSYYDDGTSEEELVPKGPMIFPNYIDIEG